MGGTFVTMKVPGTATKAEVKTTFEKAQDQDRYENGHSYSGGIGMADGLEFRDRIFKTEREADSWLADTAQKWEAALAVRVEDEAGKVWIIGAWCSS